MISKKRLLLTEDGKVVEEGNPAGVRLLVGAGGIVPDEHVELVKEYEKAAGAGTETEAEDADADGDAEAVDLESMTKAELMEFADAHGIEYKQSWSKAEILEAVSQDPSQPR